MGEINTNQMTLLVTIQLYPSRTFVHDFSPSLLFIWEYVLLDSCLASIGRDEFLKELAYLNLTPLTHSMMHEQCGIGGWQNQLLSTVHDTLSSRAGFVLL